MGWLVSRLAEKSTYKGVALVGAACAAFVGPQAMAEAAPVVALIMGAWETVRRER